MATGSQRNNTSPLELSTYVPLAVVVVVTGQVVTVVYVVNVVESPPHRGTKAARAEVARTRTDRDFMFA